jgi:hypothetical protein
VKGGICPFALTARLPAGTDPPTGELPSVSISFCEIGRWQEVVGFHEMSPALPCQPLAVAATMQVSMGPTKE